MFKVISSKIREATLSVIPVVVIVLVAFFTPFVQITAGELGVFLVCTVCMIFGSALFDTGAELSMTPMGEFIGVGLTKTKRIGVLILVTFLMGLFLTVAEPDLSVLAQQVSNVMDGDTLIYYVGIGVGVFLALAVCKIVFKMDLEKLIMFFYLLLFAIAALVVQEGKGFMIPLCVDAGGVSTGPITVPFIMALGIGIAQTIGGKNSGENSFGLLSLCAIGPIIAVLYLSLSAEGGLTYTLPDYSMDAILSKGIFVHLIDKADEVIKALALIFVFFIILNLLILKIPTKRIMKIVIGMGYTFVGLVIFLAAIEIGFMPIGYSLGTQIAKYSGKTLTLFGFFLGCVVVLAEPAVNILRGQVEEVTSGGISKKSMTIALSVGVGISIALTMIRIVYKFSILYYLIPGYIIALALTLFVPGIYSAIAFDSGGVASGPLTSSFILPLTIGACVVLLGEKYVLEYAFGVIAMVSMIPLITIQVLGFKAIVVKLIRERRAIHSIMNADDAVIIYFDKE